MSQRATIEELQARIRELTGQVDNLEESFKAESMRASKAERDLYLMQEEQDCKHDWTVVGNGGPNQNQPIEWMGKWIQWCTKCPALSWYVPTYLNRSAEEGHE